MVENLGCGAGQLPLGVAQVTLGVPDAALGLGNAPLEVPPRSSLDRSRLFGALNARLGFPVASLLLLETCLRRC